MSKKLIRRIFRTNVFNRDNYKCRVCGVNGYDRQNPITKFGVPLDAHHIIDRHQFKNGGYVLSNGISVCSDCHMKAEDKEISSDKLYELIGSSLDKAVADDLKQERENHADSR